jgi:LPPG:FO 2-phospho-L-lactate transferase
VSIGPILAIPGIREAAAAKTVVGVSGIIGGAPVRGMADACLATIGVETSASAVAAHYGPRLLNGWLVDDQDKSAADDPACAGIAIRAMPLYMRDLGSTVAIAQAAIDLALELALCRRHPRPPPGGATPRAPRGMPDLRTAVSDTRRLP